MSLRLYILAGGALAISGLVTYTVILRGSLADTKRELEHAEAVAAGFEEAARVLTTQSRLMQEERDRWRTIASELENEEGIDDELSPYLRAVLERVRNP